MLIRLNTCRATLLQKNRAGDEIDVPAEEARALIQSGQAVAVETNTIVPTPAEQSVVVETGMERGGREQATTNRNPKRRNNHVQSRPAQSD